MDNFDQLNLNRWYISDGWTNGDYQNCTWSKNEITVRDGKLRIGFSKTVTGDRQYRCGEIQSNARLGHGTYEARLKTPKGSGLNAAFFTYIGAVHGMPHDEIDFEILLKDTTRAQLNIFVAGKGGNEQMIRLPTPADQAFSDYAFVWEPDRVRWFVNGKLVRTIDDPAKIPTNDAKIYMSLWGSDTLTGWLGPFVDPGRPLAIEVDRVAFTALGEKCQFTGSVACQPTVKKARKQSAKSSRQSP